MALALYEKKRRLAAVKGLHAGNTGGELTQHGYVHPSVPAKSIAELIALARASLGSSTMDLRWVARLDLSAELFKLMTNVDIVQVPYRGNGPAMNALLASQIELMFPTFGAGMPHVQAGRLRVLGVTSLQPSALLPGRPYGSGHSAG